MVADDENCRSRPRTSASDDQAAEQGTPFKVQVGSKGVEHGFQGGMRTKSDVTEGGLSPNLLPPIQQLGPRGFWGLPYELKRVANFLPNVAMDGAGVAYFRHDSDGQEAAYTAEGATKPDLTPVITEQYICPGEGGRSNQSDSRAGAGCRRCLRAESRQDLARSLYNAESNLLLNGTTGANGWVERVTTRR